VAASPRPPSWAVGHTEFNAGVLGTARPTLVLRREPYYAPNPLRGGASSFAKASEDMSKGARGGRGGYGVETLTRPNGAKGKGRV
jgi:hypothetical protein